MSRSLRPARLIIAIAAALLVAYGVIWSQVGSLDIGRSDFTAFYVGGTLLREGHTGDLYNAAIQQPLHSALIAPDREANLPFVNTPVAAALVLPATLLPLSVAYRLWGILELTVLVLAVVLAVRSVEWPAATSRVWKLAAGAAALASIGTLTTLIQAQWTPVLALGTVLAYRSWKRGHEATSAALLVVAAGIAKPHLALGLLAFLLGWRRRRIIFGAVAGAAALALASLALVGPAGVAGFAGILASSTTRWALAPMLSFIGVVGSVFGDGFSAHLIGLVVTLMACATAVWLGALVRRDPGRLDTAFVAAVVLSLLAAPHAYPDDLVMVAPAMVIGLAAAARGWRTGVVRSEDWLVRSGDSTGYVASADEPVLAGGRVVPGTPPGSRDTVASADVVPAGDRVGAGTLISLAESARRRASEAERTAARVMSPVMIVFAVWAVISITAFIDLADASRFPPGQLAGWALLGAAVFACVNARGPRGVVSVPRQRIPALGGVQSRS